MNTVILPTIFATVLIGLKIVMMSVTQVYFDIFLIICYDRDGGDPGACLYLTLVGEGGKVCVVFRCQADRCLEVYRVGGDDREDDDIDGGGGQPLNVNDFHESHYLNLLICRCSMILNSVRYIEEFFVTGQQKKCFPGQSFSIIAKRLSTLSFSKMAHPVFRSCWSNL